MSDEDVLSQKFKIKGGDFGKAGRTSTSIKEILKEIGIDHSIVIRASIAVYEAEMNVVMYAKRGMVTLNITPEKLHLKLEDEGQGIADIDQAMKEGFSTATHEMREMGFGAGMGLPNIKKNADRFKITSIPGKGTTVDIIFCLDKTENK
ncbi:MAG: ATP-binding protein [Acidobacteria bacterium]|nr:ATP-binding protein [Acidobacteriota bacterium]MBU4255563.1 ATP-binding protein [Acidobacteriota bacterium]MBU4330952.1 ATP-binding protein [Acidobacteriota bacterium]MCG2817336.1 ATP-binding protein [Candidatus Aminicenantes bacterium]